MQNLSEKLGNVELKVRQLALKLDRLQNENSSLLEENNQLKNSITANNNRVIELEQKLLGSQQVLEKKRNDGPESSKKLRKDIEQYIQEVDKCIEWLQNSGHGG